MRDLVLTEEAAKARVLEALISGAVSAACYRMIRQPFAVHALGGAEEISDFTRISRSAWARGYTAQDTLWKTGTIKFASLGREGPFAAFDMPSECIHVRFEPMGIELLCEQLGHQMREAAPTHRISRAPAPIKPLEISRSYTPRPVGTLDQIAPELAPYLARMASPDAGRLELDAPGPRRKRDNPMTTAEIAAWHRGLSAAQKTLGVPALWDLAKRQNPRRHLPRKMVEKFGAKRGNGHRPKPQSPE